MIFCKLVVVVIVVLVVAVVVVVAVLADRPKPEKKLVRLELVHAIKYVLFTRKKLFRLRLVI